MNTINLTTNTKLKKLSLPPLGISSLNLKFNTQLNFLVVKGNNINSLDLTKNSNLEVLEIHANQSPISYINTSKNLELKRLKLTDSGINSVDISKNNKLTALNIDHNPINNINLNDNCNLEQFTCTNTNLKIIDARNSNLHFFKAGRLDVIDTGLTSPLKRVYLTGQPFDKNSGEHYNFEFYNCPNLEFICIDNKHTNLARLQMNNSSQLNNTQIKGNNPNCVISSNCGIPSNPKVCDVITPCPIINFPDPNFKQALLNFTPTIDTDGDGEICIEEAEKVKLLYLLPTDNVIDITGIKYFINLEIFSTQGSNLPNVNFNNNKKLRILALPESNVKNIYVDNCTNLESLSVPSNKLSSIDISTNNRLKELYIDNNLLNSIDITENILLERLYMSYNIEINTLDISKNSMLKDINISDTGMAQLNITSNNSNLNSIRAKNTKIEELDVRNCASVNLLSLKNNKLLKRLFLTGNHNFYNSVNDFTDIAKLDIINCPNLEFVCVKDVPFFSDIQSYINTGLGYTNCTVSTNCDAAPTFTDYFTLSPNPASSFIKLTKQQTITATSAQILNYSGQVIQTVNLNFSTLAFKPFANININALAVGNYIIRIPTNKGTLTSTFIKTSNFPFR